MLVVSSCDARRWVVILVVGVAGTVTPDGIPIRTLMETLNRMENEGSSSDEENAEHNNIMFEETASSAGCECVCVCVCVCACACACMCVCACALSHWTCGFNSID